MEQNTNLSQLSLAQLSNLYWQLKDYSPIKQMIVSQMQITQQINYEESRKISEYLNSINKIKSSISKLN